MQLPNVYDLRTGIRRLIAASSVLLPRDTGIRAERWYRGYEDHRKLAAADAVIVSFGKSGRTWLRVLLWRYFAKKNGFEREGISGFDEFRLNNPNVPVLFFTHDNYLKDYAGHDRKAHRASCCWCATRATPPFRSSSSGSTASCRARS